jgi:FHS family L-fucose permease-like MFS transporter
LLVPKEASPWGDSPDPVRLLSICLHVTYRAAAIMSYIRPRKVFLAYLTLVICFSAASITQRGNTGLAMLIATLFFESVCFPTIVALGIRGIGRHTKRGSGWIVGGVVGGAIGGSLRFD